MHIEGNAVVSTATQRTMRNSIAASALVTFITSQKLDLATANVFGVSLSKSTPEIVLASAILYFLISHLINWGGDLTSQGRWNSGQTGVAAKFGESEIATKTRLAVDGINEELTKPRTGRDDKQFNEIRKQLEDINQRQKTHRFYLFIYFDIWYYLVPIALASVSLFMLDISWISFLTLVPLSLFFFRLVSLFFP